MTRDAKFEEAIVSLYSELIVFYAKSSCYFARSTGGRLLRNTMALDDWSGSLDKIGAIDIVCRYFADQLALSKAVGEIGRVSAMIRADHTEAHLKKVLAWTSAIDVGDQHSQVKRKLGERYLASGQWLIQHPEFQEWNASHSAHFWLRGAVGIGKSSLVAIVIEHLLKNTTNMAFFYCTRGMSMADASTESHNAIYRALVAQLARSPDGKSIATELEIQYERLATKGRTGSSLSTAEAQDLLLSLIESRDEATIVVDALDECPRALEFLASLQAIGNKTTKLKLFVSSQFVVPVDEYFSTIATVTIRAAENTADIAALVEGEVNRYMSIRPGLLDEALSREIVRTLIAKADGM